MNLLGASLIVFGALATTAFAAEDPIVGRQMLMRSNSAAAGVTNAIIKDEIAYSPAVGRLVIATWAATAETMTQFFPEGSADRSRSRALPTIWEDTAGFLASVEAFQANVAAAVEASGREGPPSKEAFVAAAQPVLGTCGACHDAWRAPN